MSARPQDLYNALYAAQGALLVVRELPATAKAAPGQFGGAFGAAPANPEIFIAVLADGRIVACNGHVDLGTGIRTALAQVAAEELDVAWGRLQMVLGHTEAVPNQGPTVASATIQVSAEPLRRAAAQARAHLLGLAAQAWGAPVDALAVEDGVVRAPDGRRAAYADLLQGRRDVLALDLKAPIKPVSEHRLVGRAMPRVDIPAKVTGELTYVHDVRVPGMLHGRVVRPPYGGRDTGDFIGHTLVSVDASSIAHLPGIVRVVVIQDFVGVVAEREEQAIQAAQALKVAWREPPAQDMSSFERAIRRQPYVERLLTDQGDVEAALESPRTLRRTYVWPYQLHGSIGPSCSVADYGAQGLRVWSGTQNPHTLRADLATLFDLSEDRVEVIRLEAAGCYGRNCADDVGADAALLSRAVGRPVRLQLSRNQEHVWEPKGTAQLIDVRGVADEAGAPLAYDVCINYPSNEAPVLALLLTGKLPAAPRIKEQGDRTATPPYRFPRLRAMCHDMPPIVRASWLRGVSALPNIFAHDCFLDELAEQAGADRCDYRAQHVEDPRAAELIREVAARAGWRQGARGSRGVPDAQGLLHGRGMSYARYVHGKYPGTGAGMAAWVADLVVEVASGRIKVERIFVAHDAGMMVNPAGVRHQVHGNIIQSLSRVLMEVVEFDARGVRNREWGAYPILRFADLPEIDAYLMPRQDQPALGAGESASVPGPAAVANALFDATGCRFYAPPFTPETVRRALQNRAAQQANEPAGSAREEVPA
ncbi:MAG TPA: molybdopterin cofactor-binding domain-containing protein [Bordetella sp.]